ncbi:MAG: GNAT family N-acetyltransferase [Pirellulales bacterium]|nr:GNAT family N-acetyltransferase [Pirellulales bacterium]
MIITPVQEHEKAALLSLAVSTGLFTPEDAEGLLGGVLDSLAAGELPEGHNAVACRESRDDAANGWSYYAPDPYADKVWNVWWIGVRPDHHGGGAGQALLSHIEQAATASGVRVIVIETSDQALLARARSFYVKLGYEERGRIPDFYADGDSKVIFSRTLAGAA